MESPRLHSRFTQPDEFTFGTFQTPDGHTCRYGVMPHDDPKGNVVILHGFSEFIEKFYETIRDFHNAGYQVYTFDWRGQGKSDRYFKDKLEQVYHAGFDRDIEQLHTFMQSVVTGAGPNYALAHSMGGHILLRALYQNPQMFRAVSLSAPMLRFRLPMPRFLAWGILKVVRALKWNKRGLGGGDWSVKCPPANRDPRSRDPERRMVHYEWCRRDPELRLGPVSFEWVYHALRSVVVTEAPGYLETINTPVLIGMAQGDKIVENTAIKTAAKRLPNARLLPLANAEHEILMERDPIRQRFLSETLAFFDQNR